MEDGAHQHLFCDLLRIRRLGIDELFSVEPVLDVVLKHVCLHLKVKSGSPSHVGVEDADQDSLLHQSLCVVR